METLIVSGGEIDKKFLRNNIKNIGGQNIIAVDKGLEKLHELNIVPNHVVGDFDSISKEEQLKFCELLEHRKISTFELPKSCVIIVTANEINKDKINEEIYSLVAQI